MFPLKYQGSGWLKNYLVYRLKTPYSCEKRYNELKDGNSLSAHLDKCLYSITKENGIIFGCPIISSPLTKLAKKLNLSPKKGGTILLFLETLFSVAICEKKIFSGEYKKLNSINYEKIFFNIIFLVIEYFLPKSFYRIPKDIDHHELLKNNDLIKRALKKLEIVFLSSVTINGYSSLGNRQNNFAFSNLYFFLLWSREKSKNYLSSPISYQKMDHKLREEMVLIFATLIRADNLVDYAENNIIKKYLEQTCLPNEKKFELLHRIRMPIKIKNISNTFKPLIINSYIIEQLILLSLIANQKTWQERKLIQDISIHLGLSENRLEQLFCSVAEFFSIHYKRLEFLKNNPDIQQFQDYMNDKIVILVKKNLNKIMNEVLETKQLTELLIKSTSKKLNKQEKKKVQEQLLDIARSIPALAIFALPGGGLLLPVIIKILPFKILPSSFQDKPDSSKFFEK